MAELVVWDMCECLVHVNGFHCEITTRLTHLTKIVFAQSNSHILRFETNVQKQKSIFYLINGILLKREKVTVLVNAVGGSENVLVCDENSTAILIRLVT